MININFTLSYLEIYLLSINIFSFGLYGYDKLQAIRDKKDIQRISEQTLLNIALMGGTIGATLSMILFRHKIKKLSFMIKFIVVVLVQISISYYLIYIAKII